MGFPHPAAGPGRHARGLSVSALTHPLGHPDGAALAGDHLPGGGRHHLVLLDRNQGPRFRKAALIGLHVCPC